MPGEDGLNAAKHAAVDEVGDDDVLPRARRQKFEVVEEVPDVAIEEVAMRARVCGCSCHLTSRDLLRR